MTIVSGSVEPRQSFSIENIPNVCRFNLVDRWLCTVALDRGRISICRTTASNILLSTSSGPQETQKAMTGGGDRRKESRVVCIYAVKGLICGAQYTRLNKRSLPRVLGKGRVGMSRLDLHHTETDTTHAHTHAHTSEPICRGIKCVRCSPCCIFPEFGFRLRASGS